MEVILAKTAGFCFGVKRAVDTVYKEAGKKNVYTYGPIIHNSEVVNDLKKKGVEVINSREELEALEEDALPWHYILYYILLYHNPFYSEFQLNLEISCN